MRCATCVVDSYGIFVISDIVGFKAREEGERREGSNSSTARIGEERSV